MQASNLRVLMWLKMDDDFLYFLLDHGADVNFGDRKDLTPFYREIRDHSFDATPDFINRGGDLQHVDKNAKTFLSYVIEKPLSFIYARLL
ncbi:MAG: hypothetical protein CK425_04925 [Parachlamydia sp.]|nr:MAG: hypothetical protein CK425_04925 [Parachlamydia sp.]